MAFVEERFPVDISWGSVGGPGFRTTIIESAGGFEQRNIDWEQSRGTWNVTHGAKRAVQMERLRDWFYAMHGRAHGFRFKDWTDFSVEEEWFGDGDDTTVDFQLVKTYDIIGQAYVRQIKKPVQGTIHVFLDGVEKDEGPGAGEWELDYTTGIVTMGTAPLDVPPVEVLTWTGQFDVPVRFDEDEMKVSMDFEDVESWSLRVKEIRQ
jgi:uncharacterized protein (TIGR02217 family)